MRLDRHFPTARTHTRCVRGSFPSPFFLRCVHALQLTRPLLPYKDSPHSTHCDASSFPRGHEVSARVFPHHHAALLPFFLSHQTSISPPLFFDTCEKKKMMHAYLARFPSRVLARGVPTRPSLVSSLPKRCAPRTLPFAHTFRTLFNGISSFRNKCSHEACVVLCRFSS